MTSKIIDLLKSQALWLSIFLILVTSIGINYHNRLNCDNKEIAACPDSSKFCSKSNEFGNVFNIIVLIVGIFILVANVGYVFFEELSSASSTVARNIKPVGRQMVYGKY